MRVLRLCSSGSPQERAPLPAQRSCDVCRVSVGVGVGVSCATHGQKRHGRVMAQWSPLLQAATCGVTTTATTAPQTRRGSPSTRSVGVPPRPLGLSLLACARPETFSHLHTYHSCRILKETRWENESKRQGDAFYKPVHASCQRMADTTLIESSSARARSAVLRLAPSCCALVRRSQPCIQPSPHDARSHARSYTHGSRRGLACSNPLLAVRQPRVRPEPRRSLAVRQPRVRPTRHWNERFGRLDVLGPDKRRL